MSVDAVRFENVSFAYGKTDVLKNVSLTVANGETVSVVGPNGGGKTTLLRLILGLETPGEGKVEVFGGGPEKARESIGYMPQQMRYDSSFPISVFEVVLTGRMRSGHLFYGKEDRAAAHNALEGVGLADAAKRSFSELSGGMRQRTLIARALVSKPKLLLFDEPTSMIDAASSQSFLRTIESVRGNCTVIIVSHDTGFVSKIVNRVILVNRTVREGRLGASLGDFGELYGGDVRVVENEGGAEGVS